jgi:hypothetical protein
MGGTQRVKFPYSFEKNGRIGKVYRTKKGGFHTRFSFAGKEDRNNFSTFERAKKYLSDNFDTLDTKVAESSAAYPLKHERMYYHDLEAHLLAHTDGATLRDAVDFYIANKPKTKFKPLTVSECKVKFLADKEKENVSSQQIKTLKRHLSRFEQAFGKQLIHDITTEEIKSWLHSQKDERTNELWEPKTKGNVLGSLVTFALCAKEQYRAFPNSLQTTDFELVKKPKTKAEDEEEVEVYTAEELEQQLAAAIEHDMEVLPLIIIQAFFGLRPSEAHGEEVKKPKLRWEALNWERKLLCFRIQKVRSKLPRDIPIQPNAEKWLTPFKGLNGPIWKYSAAYDERMVKLHRLLGHSRRDNAYRHSYTSYRLPHLGYNFAALAVELGNSERQIIKSYLRRITREEADAWFAVEPPEGYAEKVGTYLALTAKKDSCPPKSA